MFDPDLYLLSLAGRLVGPQQVLEGVVRLGEEDEAKAVATFYWESAMMVSPRTSTTATVNECESSRTSSDDDDETTKIGSKKHEQSQQAVLLLNLTFEVGVRPWSSSPSAARPSASTQSSPSSHPDEPTSPMLIRAHFGCLLNDGTYWRQSRPIHSQWLRRHFEDELRSDVDVLSTLQWADNTAAALRQWVGGNNSHFQLRNGEDTKQKRDGGDDDEHDDDDDGNDDRGQGDEYAVRLPYPRMGPSAGAWIGMGQTPAPLSARLHMDGCVRNCDWIGRRRPGLGSNPGKGDDDETAGTVTVTDGDIQPVVDAWRQAILRREQRLQQQQQQQQQQPQGHEPRTGATDPIDPTQEKPQVPFRPSPSQAQPPFRRQRKKPKLAGY